VFPLGAVFLIVGIPCSYWLMGTITLWAGSRPFGVLQRPGTGRRGRFWHISPEVGGGGVGGVVC